MAKSKKADDSAADKDARPLVIEGEATIVTTSSAGNSDNPGKRKKRQLKAAAPSTLRERSEQAIASSVRPSRRGQVGNVLSWPFRIITRPFRWLGHFRPFRWLGYILLPPYIRGSFGELRLVTWPTFKQARQLTGAVIIFSLIFGIIAAIVDYGINYLFRHVILKH